MASSFIRSEFHVQAFEAEEFINEIDVDALVVCIGNVDGKYPSSGPNLKLDLLGNDTLYWRCSLNVVKHAQKVPGLLKIRHMGQTTLGSAANFGLFLGAGALSTVGNLIK